MSAPPDNGVPPDFLQACERLGVPLTRLLLVVRVADQSTTLFDRCAPATVRQSYQLRNRYCCSTSKFGLGQVAGSNGTPLGLHRIAEKHGGGAPAGTVFKARKPIGTLADGLPLESITTRILWLEGLDPGFNRGGTVDTFARYIYIHGFGDQASIGRPASHGCIHLADADLIPLYDELPVGTLVWIAER